MIKFNITPSLPNETTYLTEAIQNQKICGGGLFTKKCDAWIENNFKTPKALLTT